MLTDMRRNELGLETLQNAGKNREKALNRR